MSTFFKQLIELGEEKNDAPVTTSGSSELLALTKEELVAQIGKLESRYQERVADYDRLQADSMSLRSEFDAYKRKVDGWQRHMKEQRTADRKMIEELRAAGSTGKIDDVFVKTTNDKITQLKESLREAQEEIEKAYKKQREAEEGRVAAETAKKQEVDELCSKFDAFKERTKLSHDKYEQQISELRGQLADGRQLQQIKTQLEASERQRIALQKIVDAGTHVVVASDGSAGPSSSTTSSTLSAGMLSPSEAANRSEVAALEQELAHASAQIAAFATKELEWQERCRKMEEKLQRQLEDSEWDALEAEKRLAEVKSMLDQAKTKVSQLEQKVEAKEEERAISEKQAKRAERELEDSLATERERSHVLIHAAEERAKDLEKKLQLERDKLAQHTAILGEQATISQKSNDALESQRNFYESQLAAKDATLQQLIGIKTSLEAAIQEAKEDARIREDFADQMRAELDQSISRLSEFESQQMYSQRTIMAREEELMARERERQLLRAQLRQEEDKSGQLRSAVTELELKLSELEIAIRKKDSQISELGSRVQHAMQEAQLARQAMIEQGNALHEKDKQNAELGQRLQDQSTRNGEIMKLRDDQSAKLRMYEGRIAELESDAVRRSNEGPVSSGGSGASPLRDGSMSSSVPIGHGVSISDVVASVDTFRLPSAAARRQFVSDVMATARSQRLLSNSQWRYVVAVLIALFLLVSLFGGFHTSESTTQQHDVETVNLLREKYGQALTSATVCREALQQARQQLAVLTDAAKKVV